MKGTFFSHKGTNHSFCLYIVAFRILFQNHIDNVEIIKVYRYTLHNFFFKFNSYIIHGEGGGGCQIMMVRKRQPLIVFVSIEIIYQMSEGNAFNCLIKLRV